MRLMNLLKTGLAACFLGLVLSSSLLAADCTSIAAVSLSGYDRLDGSIAKVLDTAGCEEFYNALNMMLGGIDGIDKSQPAGFVLLTDGNDLIPFAFLPVADFDELTCPGIEVLKEELNYDKESKTIGLSGNSDDQSDTDTGNFRLIEADGWLFVTPIKFESSVPTQIDPITWLEGLDSKYLIGGILHVDRMPSEVLDTLISPLRVAASKEENLARSLESLGKWTDFVKTNVQTYEFGFSVDSSNGDVILSSSTTPIPDSSLARALKLNEKPVTIWSDFYSPEKSIFSLSDSEVYEPTMVDFLKEYWSSAFSSWEAALSREEEDEETVAKAKDLLKGLEEWVGKNYDLGRTDSALSFGADGTLSAACTIADGSGFQKLLVRSFQFVTTILEENEPDDVDVQKFLKSFKVNDTPYKGYTVTTFSIPCPMDKTYSFLVGVKDDAVILLAGPSKKVVSDLFKEKSAADRSEAPAEMKWVFSAPNLAKFIQTFEESVSDHETVGSVTAQIASGSADAVIIGQKNLTPLSSEISITIKGELIKLLYGTFSTVFQSDDDTVEEEFETDENDLF